MIKRSRVQIDKQIYLKFGELTLKGKNRREFSNCLNRNIKHALSNYKDIVVLYQYDSIRISNIKPKLFDEIFHIVKSIPGISYVIEAYVVDRDIDKLHKLIDKLLPTTSSTFKVETKRIDKNYPGTSLDFTKELGGYVLNKFNKLKVDIHNPQIKINVEIKQDCFILYFNKIEGCCGFPLGINGRVLMLISGGIDSPVAASLLMKKGFKVDFLTFVSPPHTSKEAEQKVRNLIKTITLDGKIEKPILYICKFTEIQHEISHISKHSYQITIMRRYFFRIAQYLLKQFHYDAIATGESLGQVASQTIESMTCISNVLEDVVVLRPLLTYDKIEIIRKAEQLNTYNISILPYPDACTMFVPANPITTPKIEIAQALEKELLLVDKLYEKTLEKGIKKEYLDDWYKTNNH